ncbi:3D domain-containing protein [Petroclostridium sp. X23]|uniref:3D domain-containing protein n=1 Tax=Petroclostridium sp. X23 TaxID=3045146 RepID=UPI0024ADA66B|nr:3D domain-containing protein [Petroclostridium sp. X23]WHH57438.1 3D domain-containing protein [Petroclostridium sp. X23]
MLALFQSNKDKTILLLLLVIFILSIVLFFIGTAIFSSLPTQVYKLTRENKKLEELIMQQSDQIEEYRTLIDLINEENMSLQSTIKMLAFEGKKPVYYTKPTPQISRQSASRFRRMQYVGEWLGTAYTPSAEECGNDRGITSSGQAIVPGYSIAVDTDYWNYGQRFYIQGVGMVEAMDTGSAIDGKARFDLAMFDKQAALRFGQRKMKVWMIETEE